MSLPIPLSVRLQTPRADLHVTRDLRDLVLRWTDPGGYASCQIALDRTLTLQPDEVAYYGNLIVYDSRSGRTVWEGRTEDPGRSADQGEVWDLAAVGGQAHTRDRIVPYIVVDREMVYERVDNAMTPGGTDRIGEDPGGSLKQSLLLQFPQGISVNTNSRVVVRYNRVFRAGQKLARVAYTWDAGRTSASYAVQAITRTDGSMATGENALSSNFNTAGGAAAAAVNPSFPTGGGFPDGRNTVELRIFYNGGSGTESTDTSWASFVDVAITAARVDKTGTAITAGYSGTVLASEVVADLLGRLLTAYDGAGAVIATTGHAIDQLAYPDGVDAARVLQDLLVLEPGFTWRVWERNAAGKYRFEFVAVPAVVRYEADVIDGYDGPGSADGLYNAVSVRWRDATGQVQTTVRTATVPELSAAGLTRQGQIDLGSEVGSLADAQRAGDQWLADRRYAPNGGRLRVARPILDLISGRMVAPWEIGPGLIRVKGILPRIDALNATSRDGVTVFRIVAGEYRASDGAAVLELDTYAPSTARQLADTRQIAARIRR